MPTAQDTLKAVIADAIKFPDNFVVTLADGTTLTLGDLRGFTKTEQSAIAKREKAITDAQQDLQDKLQTLSLAQQETARMYADLQEQQDKLKGAPAKPDDDPLASKENDPILGDIVKSIRRQQAAMVELNDKVLKPIAESVRAMAKAYVTDTLSATYERIIPADKQTDFPLEKLLKHANDGNYRTATGIPDIRKSFLEMTTKPITQADLEKQLKDAEAKGRKDATEEARLRVPRPGLTAGPRAAGDQPFKPKATTSVSAALDEAFEAAAKDASIWAPVDAQVQ